MYSAMLLPQNQKTLKTKTAAEVWKGSCVLHTIAI